MTHAHTMSLMGFYMYAHMAVITDAHMHFVIYV